MIEMNICGPKVGDRVRYRPYRAVWNGGRGRSGEKGTVVEIRGSLAKGKVQVVVQPDTGGVTDTIVHARRDEWPGLLEPAREEHRR